MTKRAMESEALLESMLKSLGFEIIANEDIGMQQQMLNFAEAAIIVAPHGAGLSHVCFCSQGTALLELFPHNYFNDCFARIAVETGLQYDYITCQPKHLGSHVSVLPIEGIIARVKEMVKTLSLTPKP